MIRATPPSIPSYVAPDPGQPARQDAPAESAPTGAQQQRQPDRLPHFLKAPLGHHTDRLRSVKSSFNLKAGKPAEQSVTGEPSATRHHSVPKAKSASSLRKLFSSSTFSFKEKEKSRMEESKVNAGASSEKWDVFKERSEEEGRRLRKYLAQSKKAASAEDKRIASEVSLKLLSKFQKKSDAEQELLRSFIQHEKKAEFIQQKMASIHQEIAFKKRNEKKGAHILHGLIEKWGSDKKSGNEFVPTMADEEIAHCMNLDDDQLVQYIEGTYNESARYIEVTNDDIVQYMYDPAGTLQNDLRDYAVRKGLAAPKIVEAVKRKEQQQLELQRQVALDSEEMSSKARAAGPVLFDPDEIV